MTTPRPYFNGISQIKAFVLGCDPTAFDKNDNLIQFDTVFNLGREDTIYFTGILKNLEYINLNLQNIYVQNLIPDYLDKCSADNKQWKQIATGYIDSRRQEFDIIDPVGKMPVLLTSELLYDVLLMEDQIRYSAKDIYDLKAPIPISASHNKLNRPLIPFYRHFKYGLKTHNEYKEHLRNYFERFV